MLAEARALQALTLLMRQPIRGDLDCLTALPCLRTVTIILKHYDQISVEFLMGLQLGCRVVHILHYLEGDPDVHWDDDTESDYEPVGALESDGESD